LAKFFSETHPLHRSFPTVIRLFFYGKNNFKFSIVKVNVANETLTLRPAVATASSKGDLLDGSRQMPGSLSHGRRENLSRSKSSEMREEPGLVRPNTEVGCNATCCNQTWGPSKVSRKTTHKKLFYQ
jgi:hypothetical protein